MGLQRPCWTVFFVLMWIFWIPGMLLTHVAVSTLIPPIEDLPGNVIKGLEEVFKFAYLRIDSKLCGTAAADAVKKCDVEASVICTSSPDMSLVPDPTAEKDVTEQKDIIVGAFSRSLTTIKRVVDDKYFGVPEFKSTSDGLQGMLDKLNEVDTRMPCAGVVEAFCGIYTDSGVLIDSLAEVEGKLEEFKTSDIITVWDERKSALVFLHALPWFMGLALVLLSIFWYKGGICCCCEGGTKCGLLMIFVVPLWLVSFVLFLVVLATGIVFTVLSDKIEVQVFAGNPSLSDVIDHIQTKFPKFWGLIFADMVDGLDLLYKASMVFTVVALVVAFYGLCLCCCRPYKQKDGEKASS